MYVTRGLARTGEPKCDICALNIPPPHPLTSVSGWNHLLGKVPRPTAICFHLFSRPFSSSQYNFNLYTYTSDLREVRTILQAQTKRLGELVLNNDTENAYGQQFAAQLSIIAYYKTVFKAHL